MALDRLQIRDMTECDECYVGTCTHVDESAEIDAIAKKRISWMRQAFGFRIKVALLGGKQVGFAYAIPLEISPWGPLGNDLMVLPCLVVQGKVKGKGIGRALIKAVEEEARRQSKKGLLVIAYDHDFWFMPEAYFERCGFSPVRCRDSAEFPGAREMIMCKFFDKSAVLPEFSTPKYRFKPVPGKVVVDLFWNSFCQTSAIEAERVREVAAEFGERVVIREYCADNRDVFLRHQIDRGIYINGGKIGWGYEAPREGIREAIAAALPL